jgi:hypothetical protein
LNNMKKLLIFVLFILFLLPINSHALTADGFEGADHYTYYGTTADDITLAWDEPTGYDVLKDDFEVVLYNPERNITIPLIITPELQVTFKTSKTGHWIVKLRTRKYDGTKYEYSVWAVSTDPTVAKVNDVPRGWWIFTWIASTGPIEGLGFSGPDSLNGGK